LQTATNNTPRFDHDPATGASRGLLIEEQRTNLLLRSEDFGSGRSLANATISVNDASAPNSQSTADKLVEDSSASASHSVSQGVSFTSGVTYTFSVFAKSSERTALSLQLASGAFGSSVTASFNLSSATSTISVSGTRTSASIVDIGSGWYRCVLVSEATATTNASAAVYLDNPANTRIYTGDGTSGLYIWGAQLEVGAFPTSYIPTTTAAATRASDSAVITPVSSFYNATESTLFHETTVYASPATAAVFQIDDTSTNNRLFVSALLSSTSTVAGISVGGLQPFVRTENLAAGTHKVCAAFKADDFAVSTNGASAVTDTSGVMPSGLTHARIGNNSAGPNTCHIRKIAYWPKRLTNTLLQQLTA